MEVFHKDEDGYLAWHAAHPNGFVFNRFGGTNPAYNVLHNSKCVFLWRECDEGTRTVVEKWCSPIEAELAEQADSVLGHGMWKKCGVCMRSAAVNAPTEPAIAPVPAKVETQTGDVWLQGEPAVWLGSGESEWKRKLTTTLARLCRKKSRSGLMSNLDSLRKKLYAKDIDNLLTPVLESGRDAGWFDRGFANVGSVTAKKCGVADLEMAGVVISPRTLPPALATNRGGVLIEAPLVGLDADTVKWTLYEPGLRAV